MVNGQINAEILITGSSRALVHYDPREISKATGLKAFNLGLNGSQSDMQVAVLKTYLAHNRKPKLIIHNLDLFSFQTSKEIYDPAQYMPYLNESAVYAAVKRVYPKAWQWKYLPLYGYLVEDMRFTWVAGLKALADFQPKEDHIDGFIPRHLDWTGDFEKLQAAHPDGVTFQIEPEGVRCIENLLETCRDQKIPIVFVYSPEYLPMQRLERNRTEIFAKFQDICQRFNVPLWDCSDSPICQFQQNFYNSQHLNAKGSALFSKVIGSTVATHLKE
jgi:hypothetical protein